MYCRGRFQVIPKPQSGSRAHVSADSTGGGANGAAGGGAWLPMGGNELLGGYEGGSYSLGGGLVIIGEAATWDNIQEGSEQRLKCQRHARSRESRQESAPYRGLQKGCF